MTMTDTQSGTDLSSLDTSTQSTFTSDQVDDLLNAKVLDADGDRIGSVQQVYLSQTDQQPLFITVNTGIFGTRESFIPLQGASFHDDALYVAYDKGVVKDAPNIEADSELVDDEQQAIYDYYDGKNIHDHASHADATYAAQNDAIDDTTGDPDAYANVDPDSYEDADVETKTGAPQHSYAPSDSTDDDAMTRSEEQLNVGVQRVETGRARLQKHIVTEQQTVTVPVSHEEVRIEREPIDAASYDDAASGAELSEAEHEVILTEERPVITKETVPVERVRLATDTVSEQQQVTEDVRKEQIDIDGADASGTSTQ